MRTARSHELPGSAKLHSPHDASTTRLTTSNAAAGSLDAAALAPSSVSGDADFSHDARIRKPPTAPVNNHRSVLLIIVIILVVIVIVILIIVVIFIVV